MIKNNFSYSVSVDCVIFGYDETSLKAWRLGSSDGKY